jgi:hypothetical protein
VVQDTLRIRVPPVSNCLGLCPERIACTSSETCVEKIFDETGIGLVFFRYESNDTIWEARLNSKDRCIGNVGSDGYAKRPYRPDTALSCLNYLLGLPAFRR